MSSTSGVASLRTKRMKRVSAQRKKFIKARSRWAARADQVFVACASAPQKLSHRAPSTVAAMAWWRPARVCACARRRGAANTQ
jgi:hypothetical protein